MSASMEAPSAMEAFCSPSFSARAAARNVLGSGIDCLSQYPSNAVKKARAKGMRQPKTCISSAQPNSGVVARVA